MAHSFKLQPVLKHRGLLEDQARQSLAEALNDERELLARIEEERGALATLQAELSDLQSHGISVQDLLLYESHIDHCSRVLHHLLRELEHLQGDVARRRLSLCQASQDKQLLEKLKEKSEAELRLRLQQRETSLLDEIALQFRGDKV